MRPEDNNVTAALSMTGSATGPQTEEHRKADARGTLGSVGLLYLWRLPSLAMPSAIPPSGGRLLGILLVLESERQRQRRDKRGQPLSMARGT